MSFVNSIKSFVNGIKKSANNNAQDILLPIQNEIEKAKAEMEKDIHNAIKKTRAEIKTNIDNVRLDWDNVTQKMPLEHIIRNKMTKDIDRYELTSELRKTQAEIKNITIMDKEKICNLLNKESALKLAIFEQNEYYFMLFAEYKEIWKKNYPYSVNGDIMSYDYIKFDTHYDAEKKIIYFKGSIFHEIYGSYIINFFKAKKRGNRQVSKIAYCSYAIHDIEKTELKSVLKELEGLILNKLSNGIKNTIQTSIVKAQNTLKQRKVK